VFQEGDLVEIPLPDGRIAIAWILHISMRFKDLVAFVVFGIKGQLGTDVAYDVEGEPLSTRVLGPLYTSTVAASHYGWNVFAHQRISDVKRQLTRRQVGGGVYVGDEYLGSVEELDECHLPTMLVIGMPVIYQEVEKAFGSAARKN